MYTYLVQNSLLSDKDGFNSFSVINTYQFPAEIDTAGFLKIFSNSWPFCCFLVLSTLGLYIS